MNMRRAMLPRVLTAAAAGVLAALVAACGSVLPSPGNSPNLYTLSPKNTFSDDLPKVDWQLVIEEPLAAGGLDSNRIAVKPTPFELKYFSESRWTERAPKMVQTLLVESFENTGKIVAVGREVVGLRSDFNLKSELREFQAEFYGASGQPPTVRVRINVKLVRQPRQEIVASRSFEHLAEAKGSEMSDVVEAFDEALGKVLRRTVQWAIASGARTDNGSLPANAAPTPAAAPPPPARASAPVNRP
jgi:cholesterol transport system auxiliary component